MTQCSGNVNVNVNDRLQSRVTWKKTECDAGNVSECARYVDGRADLDARLYITEGPGGVGVRIRFQAL